MMARRNSLPEGVIVDAEFRPEGEGVLKLGRVFDSLVRPNNIGAAEKRSGWYMFFMHKDHVPETLYSIKWRP